MSLSASAASTEKTMVLPDAYTVTSWYQDPCRTWTDEIDFVGMTSTSSSPPVSMPLTDGRL